MIINLPEFKSVESVWGDVCKRHMWYVLVKW